MVTPRLSCNGLFFGIFPQTYGAEAGPESAIQPMEETGMSDEVLQKVRI